MVSWIGWVFRAGSDGEPFLGAFLERIGEAISETTREVQSYMKEHLEFAGIGQGMLGEWEGGSANSLRAKVLFVAFFIVRSVLRRCRPFCAVSGMFLPVDFSGVYRCKEFRHKVWSPLVVVHDFHIVGVAICPGKADAVLVIDTNAVLTLPVPLECF
jgi:hypothetical protein